MIFWLESTRGKGIYRDMRTVEMDSCPRAGETVYFDQGGEEEWFEVERVCHCCEGVRRFVTLRGWWSA